MLLLSHNVTYSGGKWGVIRLSLSSLAHLWFVNAGRCSHHIRPYKSGLLNTIQTLEWTCRLLDVTTSLSVGSRCIVRHFNQSDSTTFFESQYLKR